MKPKKITALFVAMIMMLMSVTSFAAIREEDGLCNHHTGHTEECGFFDTNECGYLCEVCAENVQQLVDDLPEMEDISKMTAEGKEDVVEALEKIDEAKLNLSNNTLLAIDWFKYEGASFVLNMPEGYFGGMGTKVDRCTVASLYVPNFAFVNSIGEHETVIYPDLSTTSEFLSITPNGESEFFYLPEGTYTVEEFVEGDWTLTMEVNGNAAEDFKLAGKAGEFYKINLCNIQVPFKVTLPGETECEDGFNAEGVCAVTTGKPKESSVEQKFDFNEDFNVTDGWFSYNGGERKILGNMRVQKEATVRIINGKFNGIVNEGGGTVLDLLDNGVAAFDSDGNLLNANVQSLTPSGGLEVKEHICTEGDNGMCACGRKVVKAISLSTTALAGGQKSYVYFGNYQQANLGNVQPSTGNYIHSDTATQQGQGPYYAIEPIKWRVLENSDENTMLLSDKALDKGEYEEIAGNAEWETSTIRLWLNALGSYGETGFLSNAFKAEEQKVLNGEDKVFLLSEQQAKNANYFLNDNSRKALVSDYAAGGGRTGASSTRGVDTTEDWWLASAGGLFDLAMTVKYNGQLNSNGEDVGLSKAIRTAVNINPSNVLFTTPATYKTIKLGELQKNNAYVPTQNTSYEYKLTLIDNERGFEVTDTAKKSIAGGSVCIGYENAKTGTNEYISALITDENDEILYYAQLAKVPSEEDKNGTAELIVPTDIANGNYKVKLFNEQINGARQTDFASDFKTVNLTVVQEKNITIGKNALSGYDSAKQKYKYVYYGAYQQNEYSPITSPVTPVENTVYIDTDTAKTKFVYRAGECYKYEPIKWRVLTMNGNGGTLYKDSNETPVDSSNAMFLLSEYALKKMQYDADGTANAEGTNSSDWHFGDAWYWCNDTTDNTSFISSSFTDSEKAYLLKTSKDNATSPYSDALQDDTFFFLSKSEAESDYIQNDRVAKMSNESGNNAWWWLRSPILEDTVRCVDVSGDISNFKVKYNGIGPAARPAFNLNSAILFTSAANGGKTAADATGEGAVIPENVALSNIANNDGYMLTMLDSEREFNVDETKAMGDKGETVKFTYSGAKTGGNEYISAILIDRDGNVTHYGQIKNVTDDTADDTQVSFKIPTDIDYGKYDLLLFNEQINGNFKTDFSSDFKTVELEVKATIAGLFEFEGPRNLIYDGNPKTASVTSITEGMGAVTVRYFDSDGELETPPKDVGEYTVKIDIAAGTAYAAMTDITNSDWKFTITEKKIGRPVIILETPVKNRVPQTRVETEEFTAEVEWQPAVSEKFAANTVYTAVITITPKKNHTLCGIAQNEFELEGATTVENAANSNTVTAVFPKTSGSSGGSYVPRCTVTFETNGGNKIAGRLVNEGSVIANPVDPVKEGYVFGGWFADEQLVHAYDFSTAITKNIILYAKWTAEEIKLPENAEWENPFSDVNKKDWFYESVKFVSEHGLIQGMAQDEFVPDKTLTRAMLVTILWRAEGEPSVDYEMLFDDVYVDDYFAEAVRWAASENIVSGISKTTFAPNQNVTREQIAAILYRYAQFKGYDVTQGGMKIREFEDFENISEYAINAMTWAVNTGVMRGKTENTLNPKDFATRAEAAAMLQRFIEGNE